MKSACFNGAGNEARTRDLNLGKNSIYELYPRNTEISRTEMDKQNHEFPQDSDDVRSMSVAAPLSRFVWTFRGQNREFTDIDATREELLEVISYFQKEVKTLRGWLRTSASLDPYL